MAEANGEKGLTDTQKSELKSILSEEWNQVIKKDFEQMVTQTMASNKVEFSVSTKPESNPNKGGEMAIKWIDLVLKFVTAFIGIWVFYYGMEEFLFKQEQQIINQKNIQQKELTEAVYRVKNKEFEASLSRVFASMGQLKNFHQGVDKARDVLMELYQKQYDVQANVGQHITDDVNRVSSAFDFLIVLKNHNPLAEKIIIDACCPDFTRYYNYAKELDPLIRDSLFIGDKYWANLESVCNSDCLN